MAEEAASAVRPAVRATATATAATTGGAATTENAQPDQPQHQLVPGDKDVLCGRGGGSNQHPGNKHYRAVIQTHKAVYHHCNLQAEKQEVSIAIVAAIQKEGGRFLQQKRMGEKETMARGGETPWCEIGDKKAIEKTSQALREKRFNTLRKRTKYGETATINFGSDKDEDTEDEEDEDTDEEEDNEDNHSSDTETKIVAHKPQPRPALPSWFAAEESRWEGSELEDRRRRHHRRDHDMTGTRGAGPSHTTKRRKLVHQSSNDDVMDETVLSSSSSSQSYVLSSAEIDSVAAVAATADDVILHTILRELQQYQQHTREREESLLREFHTELRQTEQRITTRYQQQFRSLQQELSRTVPKYVYHFPLQPPPSSQLPQEGHQQQQQRQQQRQQPQEPVEEEEDEQQQQHYQNNAADKDPNNNTDADEDADATMENRSNYLRRSDNATDRVSSTSTTGAINDTKISDVDDDGKHENNYNTIHSPRPPDPDDDGDNDTVAKGKLSSSNNIDEMNNNKDETIDNRKNTHAAARNTFHTDATSPMPAAAVHNYIASTNNVDFDDDDDDDGPGFVLNDDSDDDNHSILNDGKDTSRTVVKDNSRVAGLDEMQRHHQEQNPVVDDPAPSAVEKASPIIPEPPRRVLKNPLEAFSEDFELRLGGVNGQMYQRIPGKKGMHDGQVMIRLMRKRCIVLDYSIIPNDDDVKIAAQNPHIIIPNGAGVTQCRFHTTPQASESSQCPKIGVPVVLYDSDPLQPASMYLKKGLCFQCLRDFHEKRHAGSTKSETMVARAKLREFYNNQQKQDQHLQSEEETGTATSLQKKTKSSDDVQFFDESTTGPCYKLWNERYLILLQYVSMNEGRMPPTDYDNTDGGDLVKLGKWVHNQRAHYWNIMRTDIKGNKDNRKQMTVQRKHALEQIPTWSWFYSNGHRKKIRKLRQDEQEERLRQNSNGSTNEDTTTTLYGPASVADPSTFVFDEEDMTHKNYKLWVERFQVLLRYVNTHEGEMPKLAHNNQKDDGFNLGSWIRNQRTFYWNHGRSDRKKRAMTVQRKFALESISSWSWGFTRSSYQTQKEEGKGKEQDPRIKIKKKKEKEKKNEEAEQQPRITIDPSTFVFPDEVERHKDEKKFQKWKKKFHVLEQYVVNHDGNLPLMAYSNLEDDGFKLGFWTKKQRADYWHEWNPGVNSRSKSNMTNQRKELLESIPTWSWGSIGSGAYNIINNSSKIIPADTIANNTTQENHQQHQLQLQPTQNQNVNGQNHQDSISYSNSNTNETLEPKIDVVSNNDGDDEDIVTV